jgi:hypothetical protein
LAINAPSSKAPNFVNEMIKALKGDVEYNAIMVGDFNISHSIMDR